jgi:hypothetical protein
MIHTKKSTYEAVSFLLFAGVSATIIAIAMARARINLVAIAAARIELGGSSEAFGGSTTLAEEMAKIAASAAIFIAGCSLLAFFAHLIIKSIKKTSQHQLNAPKKPNIAINSAKLLAIAGMSGILYKNEAVIRYATDITSNPQKPILLCLLAALALYAIKTLSQNSSAPNYHIKTVQILCLALLTTISFEYEKAHYYTNETYNGGICGRSVVVWMHRLEGYSMNPKEEILARRGRQYFFGPHAFDKGTPYSRLDGPLPQRDPNPLAEDADTAEAPQDISE